MTLIERLNDLADNHGFNFEHDASMLMREAATAISDATSKCERINERWQKAMLDFDVEHDKHKRIEAAQREYAENLKRILMECHGQVAAMAEGYVDFIDYKAWVKDIEAPLADPKADEFIERIKKLANEPAPVLAVL